VALPELMFRAFQTLDISATAVVCGCGGGELISELMPALINNAHALVDRCGWHQCAGERP
jgi:hypothetical protein